MFDKLKKAHEVLSDPHQRAIYDCLGKKGLEEKGWESSSKGLRIRGAGTTMSTRGNDTACK